MIKKISAAFLLFSLMSQNAAYADTLIYAPPTSWRMANYLNGDITVFYAGSTCLFGQLQLPSASVGQQDRRDQPARWPDDLLLIPRTQSKL